MSSEYIHELEGRFQEIQIPNNSAEIIALAASYLREHGFSNEFIFYVYNLGRADLEDKYMCAIEKACRNHSCDNGSREKCSACNGKGFHYQYSCPHINKIHCKQCSGTGRSQHRTDSKGGVSC